MAVKLTIYKTLHLNTLLFGVYLFFKMVSLYTTAPNKHFSTQYEYFTFLLV
ncbi:hypothetical protein TASCI_10314 [Tenacibaculum ascidiaceicola]